MMQIRDIPWMGESQQPVKGAHLSQKWRTWFDFPGHGAPTQASTVQAMLVHASYFTFGKLLLGRTTCNDAHFKSKCKALLEEIYILSLKTPHTHQKKKHMHKNHKSDETPNLHCSNLIRK
jgi:hypothetical protein